MDCSRPGFPVLFCLLGFAQIHVHWVCGAISISSSASAPFCLQSFPASESFPMNQLFHQVAEALEVQLQHQSSQWIFSLFKWVRSVCQVAKVLEFQLQHQSFQWIFRTDFLQDWLVWSLCCPRDSQESSPTPQFRSINSWCSAFFMVQLSHPDLTARKTIALTIWTFVSKMMSLLLNTLSKFVIAFLPSSKHLLISCLQSRSTVILEPKIWGHFSGNGNGMIYDKERCTWFITKDFNFHFITLYSVNIYIQSLIKHDLSKLRSVSI